MNLKNIPHPVFCFHCVANFTDKAICGMLWLVFPLSLTEDCRIMNSYKQLKKPKVSNYTTRLQKTLMITAIVVLSVLCMTLAIMHTKSSNQNQNINNQLKRRIDSAVVDAIDQVTRLSGGVQSNSTMKLALVRQYIYAIDQLNDISISFNGERGRLVAVEAISALYSDLEIYEKQIQTATNTTLEIRTTLLTHLTALQRLMKP